MRRLILFLNLAIAATAQKGIVLADLTWVEAEKVLTPDAIIVIPIGAESKEHGPHLKLRNDQLLAKYFAGQVQQKANVVIAPTVNYHYYPAFVDFPGSTTLRLETARDMMVDIVRSLARYGPRKFYALNTGVSTLRALKPTAEILEKDGLHFRYTNILEVGAAAEKQVKQQPEGTHADEIETSLMLYMYPETVDMRKAARDIHPSTAPGLLVRDKNKPGRYAPTGIYGDATLASRKKGEIVAKAMVEGMLAEIEALRKLP